MEREVWPTALGTWIPNSLNQTCCPCFNWRPRQVPGSWGGLCCSAWGLVPVLVKYAPRWRAHILNILNSASLSSLVARKRDGSASAGELALERDGPQLGSPKGPFLCIFFFPHKRKHYKKHSPTKKQAPLPGNYSQGGDGNLNHSAFFFLFFWLPDLFL